MKQIDIELEEREPDLEIWVVKVGGQPVARVRFELWSLLASTYYVKFWVLDAKALTPRVLVKMRARLRECKASLFCQCLAMSGRDIRFAQLFGFSPQVKINDRLHMERA